jgi:trehalose-6-phosphate synthase
VPLFMRSMGFRGTVHHFMHVPFPGLEIFQLLPQREDLLRGLCAADTVGFHTERYRDNFVEAAVQHAGMETGEGPDGSVRLLHERGETLAAAVPIGIDVGAFEKLASDPEVRAKSVALRAAFHQRRIVLSVDRLDYTKGILERLRAVERYLLAHSERAGSFVFVQVVVPSRSAVREYRELREAMDREVGRINGEQSRDGWMPIHHVYRSLERPELVAHYVAADVALVTPLRDGMNLVALEFVASRRDCDGVLVVSEFAGSAARLPGATQVNPYDVHAFAAALGFAMDMDAAERTRRMRLLRRRVSACTSDRWAEHCLSLRAGPDDREDGVVDSRARMVGA